MRIMGIDFGDARTGVAVSDLLCSIVGSTCVVPSRNREKAVADIVKIVRENDVGKIVVGLPKNMDGIIINLPAYLAGLGEDAYLTEFIPSPDSEIVEEDTPSGDDFGMDDMTMDEVPVG